MQIPRMSTPSLQQNFDELETQGYTVVPNIFDIDVIQALKDDFQVIKKKAFDLIDNIPAKPRVFEENGEKNFSEYWKQDDTLIMQAGKGRYDFYRGFEHGVFGQEEIINNPVISEIMDVAMNGEYTSYGGVVHSSAGSGDQYWHRDTNNLENRTTEGEKLVQLDDFYFTVLIPVTVPVSIENGATEFMVGSHRQPAKNFTKLELAKAEIPLGSALVFNGKANHRGTRNNSNEDRPVIYRVFHKRWYNDQFRKGIDE